MAFAAQIMILEMISLFSFFQTLSTLCPLDADVSGGAESITQECIWAGVYQFHGVYLSFVHIMFFVLLNCCIQDSMKERKEGGDIPLYLNWHNFTALSFPALFLNMVSIVLMQKYIALFENVDEWDGYVAHAFWLVLKGLAAGNIVFNVVIFWWFLQSHREVARLETVLKFIPFLNEYASVDRRVIDVEKAVEIA
ncbi:hypothetical protein BDR26DRAFT_852749 [Obelidium mucronatum]|nr:hypothetical protein BDR26DRAFT_852749 [Obelidium mucronatum]